MFLQFQIVLAVLFAILPDVISQSLQLPTFDTRKGKLYGEEKTINLTRPLPRYSNERLEQIQKEVLNPEKRPSLVSKGMHPRRRRDVPNTSYSRSGDDGESVYLPSPASGEAPPPANQSQPGAETFNQEGSFSRNFQSDNGITSNMSGYQKRLPAGGQGQAMQGQYSYTAPDGSTVNTSWTADEKGFRAKGAHISIFGLGFGRRR